MDKEEFMREIMLLENVADCFSFILKDDISKGIVVMLEENLLKEMQYVVEPNYVIDGAFEPCANNWDYSCGYLDWNRAWELCQLAIKDLLEN